MAVVQAVGPASFCAGQRRFSVSDPTLAGPEWEFLAGRSRR